MKDALGQRGEAIFTVLMTEFHSEAGPIFKPQFLGDKWQHIDFIVELVGAGQTTPYFFVQVKTTTTTGYTQKQQRLKVKIPEPSILGLAAYPAPTYIVGIDEPTGQGYLLSANGEYLGPLSSISTQFPINRETRETLWNEVQAFWARYDGNDLNSNFIDPNWR